MFHFNIASAVSELGITDGSTFTFTISNIENGDTISREVETLSTTYKYLSTIASPTITPAEGTVSSKAFDVTFRFDNAMIAEYIGTRSGAGNSIVANVFDGSTTASSTITFGVADSLWAISATDLTLTLDGLKDADAYYYPNVSVTYAYGSSEVNYLGVDPDPEWSSYEDIVGGYIDFMYDQNVQIPEEGTIATITFRDNKDKVLASLELGDSLVTNGYSYWMNCYTVEVEVPMDIPTAAENYTYVIVELQGLTYNGTLLSEQPSVEYNATLASYAKRFGSELTGIKATNGNQNQTFDVHNLNGILLKKGISKSELNTLSKGIYIVGGKKIIVK